MAAPGGLLCVYALYTRLPLAWSAWALPAVAALPLWRGPAMCARLLQSPGVQHPLDTLHSALAVLQ